MVPAFNGIITSVEPFQILTSRFATGYWWTTDKTQKVGNGKKLKWIRDQGLPILVLSESCFPNLLRILQLACCCSWDSPKWIREGRVGGKQICQRSTNHKNSLNICSVCTFCSILSQLKAACWRWVCIEAFLWVWFALCQPHLFNAGLERVCLGPYM